MSQNDYTPGDIVHLYAVATDPDTDLSVAPTTVTAEVIDPTGQTVSTPNVTQTGLPVAKAIRLGLVDKDTPIAGTVPAYTADTLAELPHGTWRYRFAGTGAHQGASEGSYLVVPTSFPS